MNNEFNTMMKEMVQTMMMSMMKETMQEMMSEMIGTKPTVANAEVETATKKAPKTLSREDFLALEEDTTEPVTPVELDFVVYGSKTARYNRSVPSDIWTINHLAITKNYGAKWSKKNSGYIFESTSALRNFLASYKIITELTDADKKAIADYKKERAARRAEYYANLAK